MVQDFAFIFSWPYQAKLFRVKLSIPGICLRLNLMNFEVKGPEREEGEKGLTFPVLEKESYFFAHEMHQTLKRF